VWSVWGRTVSSLGKEDEITGISTWKMKSLVSRTMKLALEFTLTACRIIYGACMTLPTASKNKIQSRYGTESEIRTSVRMSIYSLMTPRSDPTLVVQVRIVPLTAVMAAQGRTCGNFSRFT
jgi:hypothetical protein